MLLATTIEDTLPVTLLIIGVCLVDQFREITGFALIVVAYAYLQRD